MRESRKYSTSGVYHILYRGVNQENIFEEEKDFLKMKEIIKDVKTEMGFDICILFYEQPCAYSDKREEFKRYIVNHEKNINKICSMI